jgi:transposase InsO family protein
MDTTPNAQLAMPDRFLNPLVAKILLAYGTDPKFRSKIYTKDLLRTPTGLYLRPIAVEDQLRARTTGTVCHLTVIMVPNCAALKKDIMFACHDCPWSGHRGYAGTLDLVQRDFWWEGITADVKKYVGECHSCQTMKTDHTRPKGLMINPSIPTRRFGSWSMDMIVSLPKSVGGFDAILVVVCRLSKYTWFIPCKTSATARKCAQLVFEHVCKFVGLPDEILSDRDSRFATGHFAQALWALYGVSQYPSTAYHPETDGQTERMNKTLHEYIRSYIGPTHGNWAEHVHMAQFALNNSYSPSIGASPFYFVLGFHPKVPHTHLLHEDADSNPDAASFALARNNDMLAAQQCLARARSRMKVQYDRNRVPVHLAAGSEVVLSTRNLRLRGCAKYLPRYVGPFRVIEAVGPRSDATIVPNAYRLDLPAGWNIHPVFNINLLKPYTRGGPGLQHLHPLPDLLDDYSYVIESIVAHEIDKQSLHGIRYMVHLHATPDDSDMWEDEATLSAQCPALLDAYKVHHSL